MPHLRPALWPDLKPEQLASALESPPDRYRPVPWLAWTGDLDWEVLRGQLADMRAKGITEFFLFPIYGMELPYMSAAYWRRARQVLEYCRDHGMKSWIYDEYNWPSGVCAGTVIRDYPEAREQLLWVHLKGEEPVVSPFADLQLHEAKGTVWGIGVAGEVRINVQGADWVSGMPGYLNMLSPVASRRFIKSTHDRYHQQFAEFAPDTMPGFFTDEPGCHVRAGDGWVGFGYADGFFEAFLSRYGYDVRDYLQDLLVSSPTARRTRCHFWQLLSQTWGDAYAGLQRQWCDEHGLILTGHCLGEDSLVTHVRMSGDLWEPLKHFTIPGIDMLSNADAYTHPDRGSLYGNIDRRAFHLTCKYVHGVCRQVGVKEMFSEAYGVCDWGMNLFRQKRGFNYQLALGVTFFNDNSLITSIADFRKYAIAGKHFTQPWWRHYQHYADYNARLAALHAEGDQDADIAVLYPRSSLWARADTDIYNGPWFSTYEGHPLGALQDVIYSILDEMIRALWPFDFIFEPVLGQARVEGSQLVTEHTRYRTLILPSASDLPEACLAAIKAFVAAGGKVIFAGDLPEREVDSQRDLGPEVSELLSAGAVHVPASGAVVCEVLRAAQTPPIELSGDSAREFIASRRRLAGSEVIFVANMAQRTADITIRVNLPGPVAVCDPDTLEYYRPTVEADRTFVWQFAPWQAFLILCGEAAQPGMLGPEPLPTRPWWQTAQRTETLAGTWAFAAEPGNMLRLDYQLRPDPHNRGAAESWHLDTGAEGWVTPVDRRVTEPIRPAEAPWHWLRAKVTCDAGARPEWLVCDSPDYLEAFVNGVAVPQVEGQVVWTEENVAFDVRGRFREGENWLHVRVRTSKYNDPRLSPMPGITEHLLQPLVLVGEFAVSGPNQMGAWSGQLQAGRPWEEQGLPHFAGLGTYRSTLEWSGVGRVGLHLPETTDAIEVLVNGQTVGVRVWPPYVFDLTPALNHGENCLEVRVANTLGNLILETYAGAVPSEYPVSGLLAVPELLYIP